MDSKKQEVMEKIGKLINLANDSAASIGEKDNAMRMATKLLQKHDLEMSQILERKTDDQKDDDIQKANAEFLGERTEFETKLAGSLSQTFDCQAVFSSGKIIFFGFSQDVEMCQHFFNQVQMDAMAMSYMETTKTAQAAYRLGFVDGVVFVLRELFKKRMEVSECRDLVVVKSEIVKKKFNEFFPRTSRARSIKDGRNTAHSRTAYMNGYSAGKTADVGSSRRKVAA